MNRGSLSGTRPHACVPPVSTRGSRECEQYDMMGPFIGLDASRCSLWFGNITLRFKKKESHDGYSPDETCALGISAQIFGLVWL